MFTSVIRRTAVLAVAVASATSLVSGAAIGAGPHTTSLSIRVAHTAVAPGDSDLVSGDLRVGTGQALPGKTVTLEARMAGDASFLPIATAVSGPRGGVHLTVTPAETTRYRWVFAGDSADNGSTSGVATVVVRVPDHAATRLPTSLSIRVARPMVDLAGRDTVSGRLLTGTRPLPDRIVVLLVRPDDSTTWRFARAKRTGPRGRVAFVVKPAVSSSYKMIFQGTPRYRRARSAVVHVAIRPVAISIAVSPAQVGAGSPATVSGVLTDKGAPYAGQTVQLWGRPTGSSQAFAALASTVSGADGSVTFTVNPVHSMTYFLFFPRTTAAPAARSTVRTIVVS